MSKALSTYNAMAAHAALEDASPHRITQLLYQAVFDALGNARRAMDRGDTPTKGAQLSYAIDLMGALLDGVNPEAGELADQLTQLYRYVTRRMVLANLHNDREGLSECVDLLTPIARAWDRLAPAAAAMEEEQGSEAPRVVEPAPKSAGARAYGSLKPGAY